MSTDTMLLSDSYLGHINQKKSHYQQLPSNKSKIEWLDF